MAGQSVLDIKFQDVAAGNLKNTINKSVEELIKDITKNVQDALGISGTMSSLGVIPTREGAIGGVRFGVDDKYFDAVSNAVRGRLGKLSEAAGVKHLASVSRNSSMDALVKRSVQIYNDDPNSLSELKALLEGAGGRIIQSYPNKGGYTTYYSQFLNKHDVGNPLSTLQMYNSIGAASQDFHNANMLVQQQEAEKSARVAAAQRQIELQRRRTAIDYNNELANRKLTHANWGAISGEEGYDWTLDEVEAEKAEVVAENQEERRRRLGILSDDGSSGKKKPKLSADEQEKKSFFNATTVTLGAILVATKKILTAVLKLLDKELQQSYTAAAMNMDINDLASLEKGVEAMTGRSGVATAAARGVFSAFGPMKVSSEAARSVALAAGSGALEDVINNMTLGSRKTTEALRAILEGAYKNYAAGVNIYGEGTVGKEKAYADIADELKNLGLEDIFGAYVQYMENVPGARDFGSFLNYRRIYRAAEGAAAGRKASQVSTWKDVVGANAVNYLTDFGANTKDIVTDPNRSTLERLMEGLGAYAGMNPIINNAFQALSSGQTIDDSTLNNVKKVLQNRLNSIQGLTGPQQIQERGTLPDLIKLLDDYASNYILGMLSPESVAAGKTMASLGGGTNYFDYSSVNNSIPASVQGNGTFNIRIITDKTDVLFPGVDINADNFAVAKG